MISKTTLFAILALFALVQVSHSLSENLPHKVVEFMGSRKMRYHHFLWHNLRENWLSLDASTQHAITKLGWAPPRPSIAFHLDGRGAALLKENGSGEDFLYMHRQMVIQTNKMVADTDYERIVGWKNCPYPGDPKWPVPPTYTSGDAGLDPQIAEAKTEAFFWNSIQPTDDQLWDHSYLKTISLSRLGAELEYTIHKWMHLRFSTTNSVGFRPLGTKNPTPDVDVKYDALEYNWLADAYSSHVNPIFWKIHGWVDDHIEEWRKANGLATVPWMGKWENGPDETVENLYEAGDITDGDDEEPNEDSDYEPDEEVLAAMAKVVKIMLELDKDNHLKLKTDMDP